MSREVRDRGTGSRNTVGSAHAHEHSPTVYT